MAYVHGHAACVDNRCPFYGRNQAECCDGETADNCPAPTAQLAGPSVTQRRDGGE
jgi:hypothetical protein